MTLLLATILVLVFATFVVSVLRPPTTIVTLVGLYLLSYANVVLVAQLAASLRMLNASAFLLLHLALTIAASIWWNRAGRPPLIWRWVSIRPVLSGRRALSSLRRHPLLWVLGVGVTVAYLIGAGLILRVPPNNWDSMTYHLSRVGYWLQHNSFYPWPTPNPRQTAFPMNAEIGVMWTVLLVGTDQLAGFVQWSAVAVSMAAITGLSRLFGATRAQAVLGALVWATLPEIVLQSTSTQNDLLASAFFGSAVYLLYAGFSSQHRGTLLLSALGLGLALGTKITIFFLLPGLMATILMLCLGYGKQRIRQLLVWAGASLADFFLVGAYIFALNVLAYGHPLGPPSLAKDVGGFSASRVQMTVTNIPRHVYQALDTVGLPDSWADPLHQLKAEVGSGIFSRLNMPTNAPGASRPEEYFDVYRRPTVHEDYAGFGPLAFLVMMPAVIYHAFAALAKRDFFRGGVIAMSLSLLLCISYWRWSHPWDNRYFVLAATLCAPLMAPFFRRQKLPQVLLSWGAIGLALLVMAWTTTHNVSKPIVGSRRILEMDVIERQTINRSSMEPVLRAVERLIPADATIGTIMGMDDWDYPLFGRQFSRTVVPLYPAPESIDPDWLEAQSISFVLVLDQSGAYVPTAAADLHTLWNVGEWYLLTATGQTSAGVNQQSGIASSVESERQCSSSTRDWQGL